MAVAALKRFERDDGTVGVGGIEVDLDLRGLHQSGIGHLFSYQYPRLVTPDKADVAENGESAPGCGRRSIRHCSARQSVLFSKRRLCGAEGSKIAAAGSAAAIRFPVCVHRLRAAFTPPWGN